MFHRLASVVLAVLLTPFALAAGPEVLLSKPLIPLYFEPNQGQAAKGVQFIARGAGYGLFLTGHGMIAVLARKGSPPAVVTMELVGARAGAVARGEQQLEGISNYFAGRDPAQWVTNVPQFAAVRVAEVYGGIDLVFRGGAGDLEYDFVVRPGGDPRRIDLHFEGVDTLDVDERGDLVLRLGGRELRQRAPVVYQETGGVRRVVPGGYVRKYDRDVTFRVDHFDPRRTLVIDPAILYSRYLGGSNGDEGRGVATSGGDVFVAGTTWSANFPATAGALDTTVANQDAFVVRLNASGTVAYATYLGGPGDDAANAIAADGGGNTFVAGEAGDQFPVTAGAMDTTYGGGGDGFVAKLNPAGNGLIYSTYAGGAGTDAAHAIAIDASLNAYVTGQTESLDFPHTQGQPFAGTHDAFVLKLGSGGALGDAVFFGGAQGTTGGGETAGYGIALDEFDAWVVGDTNSVLLPVTADAMQKTAPETASQYAFLASFGLGDLHRQYASYFVGAGDSTATAVAVDPFGYIYFGGGATYGVAFRAGTYEGRRGFVAKYARGQPSPQFAVTVGTAGTEWASECVTGLAVDAASFIYVAGETNSDTLFVANAVQSTRGGAVDAFVAKLRRQGTTFVWQTYLGGAANEAQPRVAVDASGSAYLTGTTRSTDFAVVPPGTSSPGGDSDAFIAKLGPAGALLPPPSIAAAGHGSSVTVTWGTVAGATYYLVERALSHEQWQARYCVTVHSNEDMLVSANHAYEYRVRSVNDDGIGPPSSPDLATVFAATDDPIAAGSTKVKAVHLDEVRQAAGAVRAFAGLGAYPYSRGIARGSVVLASDVGETQTALNEGLQILGAPLGSRTYTHGTLIRAADVTDLRTRMR